MATLDDIVAATKILDDDPGTSMGSSGSKTGRVVDDAKKSDEASASEDKNLSYNNVPNDDGNKVSVVSGIDDGGVTGRGKEVKEQGSNAGGEFRVGDFVWAKIKSHPWWPGQVYDAKDASDFAVKHGQEGRILVAFFGDGSCSWCLPSQLVPFVESFREMSRDSSSKSFQNAVQRAVDEIGRLVEREMTCSCVPVEKRDGLARPVVSNTGVKPGVLMPEVDVERLMLPKYEPADILKRVMCSATGASVYSVLELGVLRGCLAAFYRAKNGHRLPVYHKPFDIEGLEDPNKSVALVAGDFSEPIQAPLGSSEDVEAANAARWRASTDDKVHPRRKEKTMAELLRETKKLIKSKTLKSEKNSDGGELDGSSSLVGPSSTGKRGRKRKLEASKSSQAKDGKALTSGKEIPKRTEITSGENASGEAKEKSEALSTQRERKKSRYLSPPYTDLAVRAGSSSSKMIGSELNKIAKNEGVASQPGSKVVDKASEERSSDIQVERLDISVNASPPAVKNDSKWTFAVSNVDVPVHEMLSKIQFAAVNPLNKSALEEGSFAVVSSFASAHRSSTFTQGHDYKAYQKSQRARKGKQSNKLPSKVGDDKDGPAKKKAKSSDKKPLGPLKLETGSSQEADDFMSDVKKIRQKLEFLNFILDGYHSRFSDDIKTGLRAEMKHLLESVEAAGDRVRSLVEDTLASVDAALEFSGC